MKSKAFIAVYNERREFLFQIGNAIPYRDNLAQAMDFLTSLIVQSVEPTLPPGHYVAWDYTGRTI